MAKEPEIAQAKINGGAAGSGSPECVADPSTAITYGFSPSSARNALKPEVIAGTKIVFQRLAGQWKTSRGPATTVSKMTQHPAYKEIIGLGAPAIPLLLEELDQDPDHWFAALRAITGANPVRPEDRGDLNKMAESWIEWGRMNGYWRAEESCRMVPEAGIDPASDNQPVRPKV